MADSEQKKEKQDQGKRGARAVPHPAPGLSRVSQAAGALGSRGAKAAAESVSMEQRSSASATTKQRMRSQSSTRKSGRSKSSGKKTRSGSSGRSASPTPARTRDTQFIEWWNSLESHQQRRYTGVVLLILSLLLFGALTVFRSAPILGSIAQFCLTFFGWSAFLLALGCIAFSLLCLVEPADEPRFLRPATIIGAIAIWLLLLVESRLILGPMQAGILAELIVYPLLGWPASVGHVVVIGLLLIVCVLTFRITFGHMLLLAQVIQNFFSSEREQRALARNGNSPSPFLGQRPRYSRYVSGGDPTAGNRQNQRVQQASARGPLLLDPANGDEEVDPGDKTLIDFTPDFEEDPRDDINIHKDQIGSVPRGPREARAPDPADYSRAVQGVSQQPLPFHNRNEGVVRQEARSEVMEPLPPNPHHTPAPKASTRAAAPAVPAAVPSSWKLPETSLLHNPEDVKLQMLGEDTASLAKTIQDTLRSFRVEAEVRQEDISIGPTVIRFGIRPTGKPEMVVDEKTGKMTPVRDAAGNIVYETRTRVSRIMALQNDLALVLEAKTIRMEAPVPGRPYVGVEIPNKNSRLVTLREVLESKEYQTVKAKSKLAIGLGRDVAGQVRVGDLARMPHLLIAGATGSGKSVMINAIIASFLTQATPDDVRLLMVDPKMVELNLYNGIPHLLSPVVTEVEKVVPLLRNAINEMERRYRLFSQLGVRNLDGYRKLRAERMNKGDASLDIMPAIVIIIDELADLMMAAPEEVEGMICRLAQLARATGIHLVVATQRPSVDVITGLIKANIPMRISFMVSSAVDSRTIIDMGGAERLLGRGDMLYLPADAGRPERIQGSFLADDEAETLVAYWRQQFAEHTAASRGGPVDPAQLAAQNMIEPGWEIKEQPSDDFELDDDLLDKAEEVVREYGRASISLLQRRLRIGYSRAARLIDLLEERGIIGPSEQGGRSREVLDGEGYNGRDHYDHRGEGRTMADEVEDIVAEERARDEFLKKQAGLLPPQASHTPSASEDEDEG